MKNNKFGQVTIFIIISLLLVVLSVGFFVFREGVTLKSSNNVDLPEINNFVEECLEKTTKEAIYFNFFHGGFYNLNKDFLIYKNAKFPVYFDEVSKMPSLEIIEEELSSYLEENIENCLDFSNFENQGYKIDSGKPFSEFEILEDKILIDLSYPLIVFKGESKVKFKDFSLNYDFDLYSKYKLVEEFIKIQEKNPSFFSLSYLTNLAFERDFTYEITPLGEKDLILTLIFSSDTQGEIPLAYSFALKMEEEE